MPLVKSEGTMVLEATLVPKIDWLASMMKLPSTPLACLPVVRKAAMTLGLVKKAELLMMALSSSTAFIISTTLA